MNKYKIIAICGEAGTGKDTLSQHVLANTDQAHEIISCTSRPIRENEREGINYYYLTLDQFKEKINNKDMLEFTCFNNWMYGTSYDSLSKDKINIGVFNPAGVRFLLADDRIDAKVFRVICDDKERLLRQLNREEHPDVDEIIRRYSTDKSDFAFLDFPYIELNNTTADDLSFNTQRILDAVLAHSSMKDKID